MKKPTRKQAIEYQCHECMGNYADGKIDCECVRCPLYTYMPYRRLEPELGVFLYSPRAKGKVLIKDIQARITPDQRKAAAERLRKNREKGQTDDQR
jgi:hypothetical protein